MANDETPGLQLSPGAFGPDPFTAPVPSPMDQMDAIAKRRGEGRHKTLAAMITETLAAERED